MINKAKIDEELVREGSGPIVLFSRWMEEASNSELINPNACALATSSKSGKPSVRMVLLKEFDEKGFVFYTNSESQKGIDLLENPWASLCFYWKSLGKEVRVDGGVEQIAEEASDKYFSTRSRSSQIGAWASKQSRRLGNRSLLKKRVDKYTKKFEEKEIPRPDYWCGYRIKHTKVEFWMERKYRLHDRFVYNWAGQAWSVDRLYP